MRRTLLVLLAAVAVAAAAASAAGAASVEATLKGTCTVSTTLDANGVVTRSLLTCDAKGTCACAGPTQLAYQTVTTSPGNGASGKEQGTISATGSRGSVTLTLTGTRTGLGSSTGTWKLGKVSGFRGVVLTKHGSYTSQTTDLVAIEGTRSTTVRISATLGCWDCQPSS